MDKEELKICFTARPALDRLVVKIYTALSHEKGITVDAGFVTSNSKETEFIRNSTRGENRQIHEVSSFFKKNWDSFTCEKLVMFEDKYECYPIWKYIYSDRFLIEKSYDYCVKITVGYFQFFEHIFTEGKYSFFYDEAVSTLQSYIAYLVGLKLKVAYISLIPARGGIEKEFNFYSSDPMEMMPYFHKNYLGIEYGRDEYIRAENFLNDFEKKDPRPYGLKYSEIKQRFKPKFKPVYLLFFIKYLKNRFNKYKNDKYFYMYYQSYRHACDNEKFLFRYHLSKKYYKNADYTRKYIFYPLHYQPESSTLVCAEKYEKQLFFIDSWAKSLPSDTFLYVKEHYAVLGNRHLSFYKELEKYPNVILVSPWENSRELITHSIAVTTLTGTAGFEAMLLRKPVIIAGDVFYQDAPGVIKVNDIYGKYCEEMQKWKKPDREEIIKYLCEYFRNLSEGCADYTNENTYTEKNIKLLVNELREKMKTIRKDIDA